MGIPKQLALALCGVVCGTIACIAFSQAIVANPLGIKDLSMFGLGIFFALQTILDFHIVFTDE